MSTSQKQKHSILLILLLSTLSVLAQTPLDLLQPTDSIPLDPAVRHGRLANGFTYYIKNNNLPANKVSMTLVVRAGLLLEGPGQAGLAHLLEHLAFRGTTDFPDGLFSPLERAGLKSGRDIIGNTSFEHTKYQFVLPADTPQLFNAAAQMLRGIAHGILLRPSDMVKEIQIINEEGRRHIVDSSLSKILAGSHVANILTQGSQPDVNNFNPEALLSFYKDWYRPDLETVVVVGDIDVTETEKMITRLFSDLKSPEQPRLRPEFPIRLTGKNNYYILPKTGPTTVIKIVYKQASEKLITLNDLARSVTASLYNQLVKDRLSHLTNNFDSPFVKCQSAFEEELFSSATKISALINSMTIKNPELIKPAFLAFMTELERIKRFGFTQLEVRNAKKICAMNFETDAQMTSFEEAGLLERHFVNGSAAPDPEVNKQLKLALLKRIGPQEVHEAAIKWLAEKNRDILILSPSAETSLAPDKQMIEKWVNEIRNAKIRPLMNNTKEITSLIPAKQIPQAVKTRPRLIKDEIGIIRAALPNGLKLVLKPMQPRFCGSNRIFIHGFSRNRRTVYSNLNQANIAYATDIVQHNGVGGFTKFELSRYLRDKMIEVHPYVGKDLNGIVAFADSIELETALQLIYLYFTSPNEDQGAFDNWIAKKALQQSSTRTDTLRETINSILNGPYYQIVRQSEKAVSQLKLKDIIETYKTIFSNPENFTFVVTGCFDVHEAYSLFEKYLGHIPTTNTGRGEKTIYIPAKPAFTERDSAGKGREAKVTLIFTGTFHYCPKNKIDIMALNRILQIILERTLRQEKAGVYSLSTSVPRDNADGKYFFRINFSCAAGNANDLIATARMKLQELKTGGPSQEDIIAMRATEREEIERNLKNSNFWLDYLVDQYKNNQNPAINILRPEMLNDVTSGHIKEAANHYLNDASSYTIVSF